MTLGGWVDILRSWWYTIRERATALHHHHRRAGDPNDDGVPGLRPRVSPLVVYRMLRKLGIRRVFPLYGNRDALDPTDLGCAWIDLRPPQALLNMDHPEMRHLPTVAATAVHESIHVDHGLERHDERFARRLHARYAAAGVDLPLPGAPWGQAIRAMDIRAAERFVLDAAPCRKTPVFNRSAQIAESSRSRL